LIGACRANGGQYFCFITDYQNECAVFYLLFI